VLPDDSEWVSESGALFFHINASTAQVTHAVQQVLASTVKLDPAAVMTLDTTAANNTGGSLGAVHHPSFERSWAIAFTLCLLEEAKHALLRVDSEVLLSFGTHMVQELYKAGVPYMDLQTSFLMGRIILDEVIAGPGKGCKTTTTTTTSTTSTTTSTTTTTTTSTTTSTTASSITTTVKTTKATNTASITSKKDESDGSIGDDTETKQ
jgi:hypothetical protein